MISMEMKSRYGGSLLHGVVCAYSMLRSHLAKIGKCYTSHCRHGCSEDETLEHVLFSCPNCINVRQQVRNFCEKRGLNFTIENLMCHPDVHLMTEKFLVCFLNTAD